MRWLLSVLVLGFGLACGGLGVLGGEEGPSPVQILEEIEGEGAAEGEAGAEAAPADEADTAAPRPEPLPKAAVYASNVYGVCRKYTDCDCNEFGTTRQCAEEFGEARKAFPPSVWACILARDCEGLCQFNAGTCFELYALQYTKGDKKGAEDCPEGTMAIEMYDRGGNYVRTECEE